MGTLYEFLKTNKIVTHLFWMLLFCFGLFSSCKTTKSAMTANTRPSYIKKAFQSSTINLPYNILKPNEAKGKLPLIIFLHGAGERGDDNERQLVHGSNLFIDSLDKYPAVYLFPQCPLNGYWSNVNIDRDEYPLKLNFSPSAPPTSALSAVMELIDQIIKDYPIDNKLIKIVGLSMGGMGTYEILQRRPDLFNSAIAICGGGHPDYTKGYNKKLRLWIAHGEADNVIAPIESVIMLKAAKDNNIKVKYTTYKDVGHNSWDNVFTDPNYLVWLFGKD